MVGFHTGTDGAGPLLITSTTPSIAAGVPTDPADAARGALVAFVGQVPVRCRGEVRCGDNLAPSGSYDGVAVSAELAGAPLDDALGMALEACADDGDEHTILCFVRWNHAVRREMREASREGAARGLRSLGVAVLVDAVGLVALVCAVLGLAHALLALCLLGGADRFGARRDAVGAWVPGLGLLGLVLVLAVVGIFRGQVPGGDLVYAAWGVAALGAAASLGVLRSSAGASRPARLGLEVAWACFGVLYHGAVVRLAHRTKRSPLLRGAWGPLLNAAKVNTDSAQARLAFGAAVVLLLLAIVLL